MKNIIKIILTGLFISFSSLTFAQSYTTKDGYSACISKNYINKLLDYANDRDYDAMQILYDNGVCISMKAGVTVYVADTSWGLVEIRPQGQTGTLWTVMEAIRRN